VDFLGYHKHCSIANGILPGFLSIDSGAIADETMDGDIVFSKRFHVSRYTTVSPYFETGCLADSALSGKA